MRHVSRQQSNPVGLLILIVAVIVAYPLAIASGSIPPTSVETIQLQSKLVNATLPYNVILPGDYRTSKTTRYPVLYLLHGLGGHYSDWLTRTNVADYAAQYRMIVVMPEGNDSWYVDGAAGVNDKYESYILKELMPDVDKRYRTIQTRYGRAIAGLSMGGGQALRIGLKHPDRFAWIGGFSSALFGKQGGMVPDTAARKQLRLLWVSCGDTDRLIKGSEAFHAALEEAKVPHIWHVDVGGHTWPVWRNDLYLIAQMLFRDKK